MNRQTKPTIDHLATARSHSRSRRFCTVLVATCVALLAIAAPSIAAVTERPFLFAFDGTSDAGPLVKPESIAIDNATGTVYIADHRSSGDGFIAKFDADGTPADFSATGTSALLASALGGKGFDGVAVDNSGGATQSRILVSTFSAGFYVSVLPDGQLQWKMHIPGQPRDVAVDTAGDPWYALFEGVSEYSNSGNPPAQLSSVSTEGAVKLDLDSNGNLYVGESGGVNKYVGGSFDSTIDPGARDLYVDQSDAAGHIFTVESSHNEIQNLYVDATSGEFTLVFEGEETIPLAYDATDAEIESALVALPAISPQGVKVRAIGNQRYDISFGGFLSGADIEQISCVGGPAPLSGGTGCKVTQGLAGIASSGFEEFSADGTNLGSFGSRYLNNPVSVAYNPTLDRVYVLEGGASPTIAVFGPKVTGDATEPTIDPPTAIGVSTAHFSGAVNPQGAATEWHFEWRKPGQTWAAAASSPPQPLPADASNHTVEYTTNALRGGTSYQVRLVVADASSHLSGFSPIRAFHTDVAAAPPVVTIGAPSATATTAEVQGTVDPEGDSADWRLQLSVGAGCAGAFEDRPSRELTPATSAPTDVEEELTGLLPSERYCVRIVAANSAGSVTSSIEEFETLDVPPAQVFTAYAAPRTDTTARLNGYINPQGSAAAYFFEYSVDGSNWITLPTQQTSQARRQIVVGEEVSGLQPGTTYHYRFAAETSAGPAAPQGEEKTFTTRTTAELQLPSRGIELVNQPDKGNQNISPEELDHQPLSTEDGNKVLWTVTGGAPNANAGAWATFMATRTADGWVNRSLVPAPQDQLGGGNLLYKLNEANRDFTHFLFRVVASGATSEGPPTFVSMDDLGNQDVLQSINVSAIDFHDHKNTEMTEDASDVLFVNPGTKQLEDATTSPPEVISLMPDGTPNACGLWTNGEYFSGFGGFWRPGYRRMARTDGSRVYFQAIPNGKPCGGEKHRGIYYRDRAAGSTTEIDPGGSESGGGSILIRTTPDGRRVYFVSDLAHDPSDSNSAYDVYTWDADTGTYSCLTCIVPEAAVSGRVLVSDDFSHVYFMSSRQLDGHGTAGDVNLYVLRNGRLGFVADLAGVSSQVLEPGHSELSADGNVLVFRTQQGDYADLTADQFGETCRQANGPVEVGNGFCAELFRYEDSGESLECITCRPDGVTVNALGAVGIENWFGLSADGSTVAFVTRERLLEGDINNSHDIYEWRNGVRRLITDGETHFGVGLFGTSPAVRSLDRTGDNIFFTLVDPGLTGYEQDELANLYDARVGGGFPRPQGPTHCSEESCQGPLLAPPSQRGAGSDDLIGTGNVAGKARRRCAGKRGKARRRCLHRHKKHTHKKHHHSKPARNGGGAK